LTFAREALITASIPRGFVSHSNAQSAADLTCIARRGRRRGLNDGALLFVLGGGLEIGEFFTEVDSRLRAKRCLLSHILRPLPLRLGRLLVRLNLDAEPGS
jgi:hypothetical protein